jgi:hypothetical protein
MFKKAIPHATGIALGFLVLVGFFFLESPDTQQKILSNTFGFSQAPAK